MHELPCKGIDNQKQQFNWRNCKVNFYIKLIIIYLTIVKYIGITQQAKPNSQLPLKKMSLHYLISSHTFLALQIYEQKLYAAELKPNPKTAATLNFQPTQHSGGHWLGRY